VVAFIALGTAAVVIVTVVVLLRHWRDASMSHGADSDLRDAFVGILMTVGPFFGVRYQPPRVEIPVVTTPASDELDPAKASQRLPHQDGSTPEEDDTAPE
jgi:hypothetical protein